MLRRKKKDLIVKHLLNPILVKIGFPELRTEMDRRGMVWSSSLKKEDGITQTIELWDVMQGMNLRLRTNAFVRARYMFLDEEGGNTCFYQTEEKFSEIIGQYGEFLLSNANKILEQLSVPPEGPVATRKNNWLVYEAHDAIAEERLSDWGLLGKSYKEIHSYLLSQINSCRDKRYQEVEAFLVDIASVYGACTQRFFGGEWVWFEEYGNTYIKDVGKKGENCVPLSEVLAQWKIGEEAEQFFLATKRFI